MDLKQLQAMGAMTPNKVVARQVKIKRPVLRPRDEWADPDLSETTGELIDDSITIHIRRGSAADALELAQASKREQPFVAIQRFICTPTGEPVFPDLETAMQIETWLALPLFDAITEARGASPKTSRRRTSSGANSPSRSADEASLSGNTP